MNKLKDLAVQYLSRFATVAVHYFYGLVASCFNAGISAIKISGGVGVASAIAPTHVSTPDLKEIAGIFVAAVFWEAIDYFNDHKLPVTLSPTPIP